MARYNAKLTKEVCCKICEALEKGHSIRGACGLAGIGETTYYDWYNRGLKAKSGKYKQFTCDVDNAKAKAISKVEDVIIEAIPHDVGTAKWWLVKHDAENYADRTFNETKLEADVKSEVTVNLLEKMKEKRRDLDDLGSD